MVVALRTFNEDYEKEFEIRCYDKIMGLHELLKESLFFGWAYLPEQNKELCRDISFDKEKLSKKKSLH